MWLAVAAGHRGRDKYVGSMAVVARTLVEPADRASHDRLFEAVTARIMAAGRAPEGLMAALAHPSPRGFLIVTVCRSENDFRCFWADVMQPAMTETGLSAGEPDLDPVWSLAQH